MHPPRPEVYLPEEAYAIEPEDLARFANADPDQPVADYVEPADDRPAQDDLDELGAGVAPVSPRRAIANMRALAEGDVYVGVAYCLKTVRSAYGVAPLYPDAETAWEEAEAKHRTSDPHKIPRGAPVFWTNGRFGHVAVSAGGGMCWTTDYRRTGYVNMAPIAALAEWCGGRLVGWSEDVNGVTVYTPPPPPPTFDLDNRIALIRKALKKARAADAPAWRITGLEGWLDQLRARRDRQNGK